MGTETERLRDAGDRARRATAILDAAADLLLRHGYRRGTIHDVAAGAQLRQGTGYLRREAPEHLFSAGLQREGPFAVRQLPPAPRRQAPHVRLLHRFAHTYFLAIAHRPLLRGFLLADPELLGRLATSRDASRDNRHSAMSRAYLELLAQHGLLRDDMDIDQIRYAYQATFECFLQHEATATADGLDQRADLLARTIQRAFESDAATPDATLQDLAAATITLLTDLINTDQAESSRHE